MRASFSDRFYIAAPQGVAVKRVGLVGLEKVPVREGTTIVDSHGHKLGRVTSGTLGPTVHEPVAMAYLAVNHAAPQHEVYAEVRGKGQITKAVADMALNLLDVDERGFDHSDRISRRGAMRPSSLTSPIPMKRAL